MKKKIVVPYFPQGLKYATPIFFGAGIYLAYINLFLWAILIILIAIVILTTNYITELDLQQKRYSDYLLFLGIKLNEESKRYSVIEKIIVTKVSHIQPIKTRIQSRQLKWAAYTGTLIFDEDQKLNLLTKHEKKELLKGLKEFADFLKTGVEDRTSIEPYWIDLGKID